jgi:hypothetical protein
MFLRLAREYFGLYIVQEKPSKLIQKRRARESNKWCFTVGSSYENFTKICTLYVQKEQIIGTKRSMPHGNLRTYCLDNGFFLFIFLKRVNIQAKIAEQKLKWQNETGNYLNKS